jgi:hypothetical protein
MKIHPVGAELFHADCSVVSNHRACLFLRRHFSFQDLTKLLTVRQLSSLHTNNLLSYCTSAPEHLSKHLALGLNTPNETFTQAAADSLCAKAALPQRCDFLAQRVDSERPSLES